jgi:hypothetical protein
MINQTIVMYVVAGVLAVLLIVLVLEFFLLRNKLNRLYRKYMYFMKSAEGGSIEVKLSTEVRELREMIASSKNSLRICSSSLSRRQALCATTLSMTQETSFPSP